MQFTWNGQEILLSPFQLEIISSCSQLSEVVPKWIEQIEECYKGDMERQNLITELEIDKTGPQEYYLKQGLLMHRGKWVLGSNGELRKQVFDELHAQSNWGAFRSEGYT